MSDAPYGGFYQFPLCVLAMPRPFEELLNYAMRFGVVAFLDKTDEDGNWRRTFSSRKDGLTKAQKVIGFSNGDIEYFVQCANEVATFLADWRRAGRKTCDARVRRDLMFGTRDDGDLTEREFRTLVGLYSAIGAKPYVKIGWQSIQCRAAGWLTTPPPEPPSRPCGPLYPRGQIERSLAELLARELVAGATYKRGERYWSHRLSRDELWEAVKNRKLHRHQIKLHRAAGDAEQSAKVELALRRAPP